MKRIVALMLAVIMVFGATGMAFAAGEKNYDVFEVAPPNKFVGNFSDILDDDVLFEKIADNPTDYYFFYNGKKYTIEEYNATWERATTTNLDLIVAGEITDKQILGGEALPATAKPFEVAKPMEETPAGELEVVEISAINSTQLKVTFNKEVDQISASTPGNYTLTRISNSTPAGAPTVIFNSTTKKEVLLTFPTTANVVPMVKTTNGYALEIANIKDTATPPKTMPTTEILVSTVGTDDTEKPALYGASYETSTGKLTLTFNKNISLTDANFDETGITVKGTSSYALTEDDYTGAASSTGNTVTITLTASGKAAVNALGSTLTLDVVAGAFKDAADITRTNDAITAYPVTLTSAPILSSATYDENTSMLTLNFDQAVKVGTDIDLTKISIKRDGVSTPLTTANATVQNTEPNSVVSINLKSAFSHAGTTVLAKVSLAAGAVKNAAGTANLAITDANLTYTDDTTKPTLVSASYNSGTKLITLKFSEIVDRATMNVGNVKITDGTTNVTLTDAIADSQVQNTTNSTDIIISVDSDNNLTNGSDYAAIEALDASKLKVYFAAGTVKDLAANSIDEIKVANAVAISVIDGVAPTFTMTDPSTVSTKATVNFSEKVNKADAENVANYQIKSGAVVLAVTQAKLLADGKTVELTTEEQAKITYTVKISNVRDLAGNVIDNNVTKTFVGVAATADTTPPTITGYKYTDVDGSKSISKSDTLELTFSEPLNVDYTKVTYEDFFVNGAAATATSFGTGATFAAGAATNQIVITLGTSPALAFGNTVDVATTNDIKDFAGFMATTSAKTITNPGIAPKIISFDYADTNGSGAVDAGDKLVITYDRNINVTGTVTATDFSFVGITTGAATFAKTAANQITMTLAADSTITWATPPTIDEGAAASTVITDEWGVAQAAKDSITTPLKSADKTNPTLVSITFKDTNGNKVMDAGETVTIVMSEPVHKDTANYNAGDFILYNGVAPVAYAGDGTNVAVVGNVITITIATGDGWETGAVTTNTTFNFGAGTKSIKDASGNNAAPDSGFGKTITIQ